MERCRRRRLRSPSSVLERRSTSSLWTEEWKAVVGAGADPGVAERQRTEYFLVSLLTIVSEKWQRPLSFGHT
ncbi:hypothetical protein Acr_23g0002050 [Actinidia rufa]|uniref:Uncharacterized protein n=1 Tax=Actinidia rufa TaxID=165716 RepID=A0A7J0GM02_9ERIC|nr:hypothetical protein Acr_23g0002050 [Actinidia rufa]